MSKSNNKILDTLDLNSLIKSKDLNLIANFFLNNNNKKEFEKI